MPCKCFFGANVPCTCVNILRCPCVAPCVWVQDCCPCDGCCTKQCCEAKEMYVISVGGAPPNEQEMDR
jgi:hypothetical protein